MCISSSPPCCPCGSLKQPRDYMTTFMFIRHDRRRGYWPVCCAPDDEPSRFHRLQQTKSSAHMFPILFVTVACGAVSGFHSLVSSGTSSKTVENEKDMLEGRLRRNGSGEPACRSCPLRSRRSCCCGWYPSCRHSVPDLQPRRCRASLRCSASRSTSPRCFMTMCVSALALTSLDAVARIATDELPGAVLAWTIWRTRSHGASFSAIPTSPRL